MHFFKALLVGAIATAATAQNLAFTNTPSTVEVGKSVTISFTGAQAAATIILRKGLSGNLDTIGTLTETATGGSYVWLPEKSLVSGTDYALQIKSGGFENYSPQFAITGGQTQASIINNSTTSATSTRSSLSITSVGTAASGTGTTISRNQTLSSATLRPTTATTSVISSPTGAAGASGTTAPNPNAAAGIASPLAFVLCAVAAMVYLN